MHTRVKWPEAPNLVQWSVQNAPRQPIGLTSSEILSGRCPAIPGSYIPAKTNLLNGDEWLTQYILYMQKGFKDKRRYAQWCHRIPPEMQVRVIQPEDKVLIKVFFQK